MPVGFSFSLLDMARNRLSLGGVRLTRPIFIAFQVSGSRTFGIGLAALSFVLRNLQPPVSEILKLGVLARAGFAESGLTFSSFVGLE